MTFSDLLSKFEQGSSPSEPLELPPKKAGGLEQFIQRFNHVSEEYSFYNGDVTLRFDKDAHQYFRVGELGNLIAVPGVTTVLRVIDRSNALVPWASKMCAEKILRLMPVENVEGIQRVKPLTLLEFTTLVLESKSAHKDRLESAGDVGTMAHDWLELYTKAVTSEDISKQTEMLANKCTDERATNCVNSALNWIVSHNVRYKDTERKVYSKQYDFAGTLDGLALVDSCNDPGCCTDIFKNRLSLLDYKTSNHLHLEYLFQTAAYCQAYTEEFSTSIMDRYVLRLGKESGDLEVWHAGHDTLEQDLAGFLTCLSLCATIEVVEERMKKQGNSIKAIRKAQKLAAKELKKEQEKAAKALEKAEQKRLKQIEKEKIKEEAKLRREELKAHKKLEKTMPVTAAIAAILNIDIEQEEACTFTSNQCEESSGPLDSGPHVTESDTQSPTTAIPNEPQSACITLTEGVTEKTQKPTNVTHSSAQQATKLTYEEEPQHKPMTLPEER